MRPPPRSTLFPYTTLFRSKPDFGRAIVEVSSQEREYAAQACSSRRILFCPGGNRSDADRRRSEEHTSELQSHSDLVCRLLLEKKKTNRRVTTTTQGYAKLY